MQQLLFETNTKTIDDISKPATYKGIYAFHKYWGKKPAESLSYFIKNHSSENDIVLDPFLGSGLISIEALAQNRRFIGIDINPFSIEHAMFLMNLPDASEYINAVKNIERRVKEKINLSYRMKDGKIASHYLWNVNELRKIWIKPEIGRCRIEIDPDGYDLEVIDSFKDYVVRNIRKANFFTNSRINSKYHTCPK